MQASRRQKNRRRLLDIGVSHPGTINLKPLFSRRYRLFIIGGIAVVAFAGFLIQRIFTRAEIATFFSASCLGTWQDPQNAQGQPENLVLGFANSAFNASNSAIFAASSTQIFCGGFLPPDFEPVGEIKRVGITFVWNVVSDTAGQQVSTGEAATSSTGIPPEIPIATSTLPENPATSTTLLSPEIRFEPLNSWWPVLTVFAQNASATPAIDAASSTSPPAVSGETQASSSEASSTPIILGPPLTATLSPISTSTIEPTSTTIESTLIDKSTSTISSTPLAAPPAPDENFLEVSYSIDGVSWVMLGKISPANWQNFTVSLPITNWDDLKRLQVKVSGTPTSLAELPSVFLDGMFVEAEYELPPALSIATSLIPKSENQASETAPPIQIFDPEARHKCKIEPFTRTVKRGNGAEYAILLQPFDVGAAYELITGDLPPGVSAYIAPMSGRGASSSMVYFNVDKEAQQGSFDVVVIYREENQDGRDVPNFCQLNLIVE